MKIAIGITPASILSQISYHFYTNALQFRLAPFSVSRRNLFWKRFCAALTALFMIGEAASDLMPGSLSRIVTVPPD